MYMFSTMVNLKGY